MEQYICSCITIWWQWKPYNCRC